MSRALLISAKAQDDLVEIWRWTFQTFGEIQADRYLGELGEAMNAIALAPERGSDRGEIRSGYRSVLVGRHVVFYTFTDSQVVVVRVLHGRMDIDMRLGDG